MPDYFIEVKGLDKVMNSLHKFPREIAHYLGQAGDESAKRLVFPQQGIKKYPPATAANRPPTPYYIRGRGTQTSKGNKGNSERFGTQWYSEQQGFSTVIGNRASYAKYLAGEDDQARAMANIGWRKLVDVVGEQLPKITRIYQAWVDKLIHDLGL